MGKIDTLTQCELMVHRDGKKLVDVAWIDTKLAKRGLKIKFRDLEGIYEVTKVFVTKRKQDVEAFERVYVFQRIASDIKDVPDRIGTLSGLKARYQDDPPCHLDEIGEDKLRRRRKHFYEDE